MNDLWFIAFGLAVAALGSVSACWLLLHRSEARVLKELGAIRRSAEEAVRLISRPSDRPRPTDPSQDPLGRLLQAVERYHWNMTLGTAQASRPLSSVGQDKQTGPEKKVAT